MELKFKATIEANVDAFIIPNSLCSANMYGPLSSERLETLRILAEKNGLAISDPETTPLVQIWWVSQELGSDNLVDHGINILHDRNFHFNRHMDGQGINIPMSYLHAVPVKLFEGHMEGSIIDIQFSHNYKDWLGDGSITQCDVDFIFHTRLSQRKFRYSRFGDFEKVLEDLMQRYWKGVNAGD